MRLTNEETEFKENTSLSDKSIHLGTDKARDTVSLEATKTELSKYMHPHASRNILFESKTTSKNLEESQLAFESNRKSMLYLFDCDVLCD